MSAIFAKNTQFWTKSTESYMIKSWKKIYTSGSSSLKMYIDLKESLAGRKIQDSIYPQETEMAVILTDCQDKQIQFNNKTIYFKPWYRVMGLHKQRRKMYEGND